MLCSGSCIRIRQRKKTANKVFHNEDILKLGCAYDGGTNSGSSSTLYVIIPLEDVAYLEAYHPKATDDILMGARIAP